MEFFLQLGCSQNFAENKSVKKVECQLESDIALSHAFKSKRECECVLEILCKGEWRSEREREWECVCVWVGERECVWERRRKRECVWERERERDEEIWFAWRRMMGSRTHGSLVGCLPLILWLRATWVRNLAPTQTPTSCAQSCCCKHPTSLACFISMNASIPGKQTD